MKKQMLLFFAAASLYSTAKAQSIAYFYRENMTQSTVEPRPGLGEYCMTETRFDPSGRNENSIHFTHYDQTGGILANTVIDQRGIDDRNVDLTYISGDKYLLTAYYRSLSTGLVAVNNMIISPSGTVATQMLLTSTNPKYPNLYPLDATYDAKRRQIVVCGVASEEARKVDVSKVAFVATLDLSLSPTNMRFYDTYDGTGGILDYDMANRIVQNSTGDYYITGSENAKKDVGTVMAIRNMLIDPTTLNPIWTYPLVMNNGTSQENSVDMAEAVGASGKKEFYTLINSTLDDSWSVIRIDPGSGTPTIGIAESYKSYVGYGFNIAQGNKSDQLVVSGMKYRGKDRDCYDQDEEATPFMATIYINAVPASLLKHVEYYTKVGNNAYWTTGELYQPAPGTYPVPVYLNNFADREATGKPYSVVTPLYNPSGSLNTKYLDVDPTTKNGCDDVLCTYDEERLEITKPENGLDLPDAPYRKVSPREVYTTYNYYDKVECASGYYRGDNATGVANVAEGEINIYPNPATDKLAVQLNSNYTGKDVQIALYDMAGKKIAVLYNDIISANKIQVALPANISTGIYMLQINADDNTTITKRITVNK